MQEPHTPVLVHCQPYVSSYALSVLVHLLPQCLAQRISTLPAPGYLSRLDPACVLHLMTMLNSPILSLSIGHIHGHVDAQTTSKVRLVWYFSCAWHMSMWNPFRNVLWAIMVSSFGKVGYIMMVMWEYPMGFMPLVPCYVYASHCVALRGNTRIRFVTSKVELTFMNVDLHLLC